VRPKDYHQLIVWQKAMTLARESYAATNCFPREELFGLKLQIRRAAVSIAANIAEGHGRLSDLQFRHFLGNARGSLSELQTEIELSRDLGSVKADQSKDLIEHSNEVARLLNGLIAVMPAKTP
jgi:four helix bundle protein